MDRMIPPPLPFARGRQILGSGSGSRPGSAEGKPLVEIREQYNRVYNGRTHGRGGGDSPLHRATPCFLVTLNSLGLEYGTRDTPSPLTTPADFGSFATRGASAGFKKILVLSESVAVAPSGPVAGPAGPAVAALSSVARP